MTLRDQVSVALTASEEILVSDEDRGDPLRPQCGQDKIAQTRVFRSGLAPTPSNARSREQLEASAIPQLKLGM